MHYLPAICPDPFLLHDPILLCPALRKKTTFSSNFAKMSHYLMLRMPKAQIVPQQPWETPGM